MLFGAYWREKPTKMHPGNASNSWSIRVGLNRHYDSRQNCAFSGISWASNNNELIPAQRLVGQQIWGTAQVTGHVIVTIRQSALPTTTVSLRNDICAEMLSGRKLGHTIDEMKPNNRLSGPDTKAPGLLKKKGNREKMDKPWN
ncbi:hypothetical protein B0H19DRAFT_1055431 [Mycena capillaripes]|nr:hypothetical protein B0H19DRAFT_1055431 [Mycena capillaripes]